MNIETVNELIQSLESAGELSIREQKFLKLAKEFSICSASLDAAIKTGNMLADQNAQLAAENVEMKQIIDSVTNLDNEPQYHDEGMGCGLEDRGITDRYDACRYGWDEAMERIYGEVIPCADELDFSATDRFVAGIKADGRVEGAHFVANRMLAAWDAGFIEDTAKNAADIARMILASTEFMANAPEGDFDRSFADDILADIAKQLREGAGK
ncbi:TPA: hypothetical protein MCO27_003611 [Klebsiella pneumoniae]|uniref:hypothetical protein n=1 Tax=Klebsiella pneumoniae TaxID=573 RepID=UPI00093760B5|nr:hypothetical protein [Klebsiella pneumoniae]RNO13225.1 hypothetical protein BL131_00011025 [Klebsiella pneumoniae]HBU0011361.1 hypothetical protein [Klebsiella pneumoniae]HBU3249103.1 hypothetical protein [Klebsiella pneumoniae]HBW1193445.1 hypothetical protein [Klebsiella pneumoniae]